MSSIKIAFFDTKKYDREMFEQVNKQYGFELFFYKDHLNVHSATLTKGMDAVCLFVNDECNKRVIDILAENNVKLIALRCAGFNNVDLNAAKGKITVVRVPAYSPHAVAEYAVAMMLALNRKIYRSWNRTREGNFKLDGLMGFDMYGKTAGIIGMGKIGKELAKILRGFGMTVLGYDAFPDNKFAAGIGMQMVSLDCLYENSDIISLHCPLTADTTYMINGDALTKMKYGVMIINTGRGKLIKTEDLIAALRSHQVGSVGLDVYEEEAGYFYEDRSDRMIDDEKLALLLMMPNVIVSSHQAFFTREAVENIATTTMRNIADFAEGKRLDNQVKA